MRRASHCDLFLPPMTDIFPMNSLQSTTSSTVTVPMMGQIESLVKDVPGWTPCDQLFALFSLVYASTDLPGDIIEVGSWCGRSSAVLGMAAKLTGHTKVHCIDLFPERTDWYQNSDGTYSLSVKIENEIVSAYDQQTVWAEAFDKDIAPLYQKHRGVFEIFRETVERNGLNQVITPHKGTLAMFSKNSSADLRCKLAFIDGDHGYRAVCADIRNIERFLVPGGWICFDDAFAGYEGSDQAITELVLNSARYELGQQLTRKLFVARRKG